jgi:hypothetical protein
MVREVVALLLVAPGRMMKPRVFTQILEVATVLCVLYFLNIVLLYTLLLQCCSSVDGTVLLYYTYTA